MPKRTKEELLERFWKKISPEPNSGCWIWEGASAGRGYPSFWNGEKGIYAHRFSYQVFKCKEINDEIDHVCRNICCVNPDHLEDVTSSENKYRSVPFRKEYRKWNAEKTHCPKGHPYIGENLYIKPNGNRECRECNRDYQRFFRASRGMRVLVEAKYDWSK